MTAEAAAVLQTFYLELREKHKSLDSTPITTRQLESMIRLAEARAKIDLREFISEQDARDVVEIMSESLYQVFEDQFGNIDFRKSNGLSNAKQLRKVSFLNSLSLSLLNSLSLSRTLSLSLS